MLILGIESTCDETGIALVENGKLLVSSKVASSLELQSKSGGIIPEVAAREQVKVIIPAIKAGLVGYDLTKVDAFAVSSGPGLIGSLLIGVETAKALSLVMNKPLIAVNHLVGHVFASWIENDTPPKFPLVALIVSGGHTDLVYMSSVSSYELMGSTLDDSAGEAFDKVARILGFGYPGGPEIDKAAAGFGERTYLEKRTPINFPTPLLISNNFNFSFSGLKTSVGSFLEKNRDIESSEIAYSFQESVCKVLIEKTLKAAKSKGVNTIVVGGGVSANRRLRKLFKDKCKALEHNIFFPEKKYSVDNGAMIAAAAFYNKNFVDPLKLQADPNIHF